MINAITHNLNVLGSARQRIKPGPYTPIPGGKRDEFI